jgi:hypothetical protein
MKRQALFAVEFIHFQPARSLLNFLAIFSARPSLHVGFQNATGY